MYTAPVYTCIEDIFMPHSRKIFIPLFCYVTGSCLSNTCEISGDAHGNIHLAGTNGNDAIRMKYALLKGDFEVIILHIYIYGIGHLEVTMEMSFAAMHSPARYFGGN